MHVFRFPLVLITLASSTTGAAEFDIPAGDVPALRAALATAAGNLESNTIRLAANSTYTLVDAGIVVPGGTLLEGNSSTIARSSVAGTPTFTVVTATDGSNTTPDDDDTEIRDLTIANGRLEDPGFGEGGGGFNNANEDGPTTLTLAKPPGLTGIAYQFQSSPDLQTWSPEATTETPTILQVSITTKAPHFLRLLVTQE